MRGSRRGMAMTRCSSRTAMTLTFAEMDADEKNRISHRADAFAKLARCFEGD
jgi:inosine/xanthosine triphosphate pyrophosphatase family protein